MEFFLIIIIIILAYLLLKKKNNKTVEGIEKKADVYGKAFKKAASTFKESIKDTDKDLNLNEDSYENDDEITKEEISNIYDKMEKNKDESYSKVQKLINKFLIGQIDESFIHNTIPFEEFKGRVIDDYSLACICATVAAFLQDLQYLDTSEEEKNNSELRLNAITSVSILEILQHTYKSYNKDTKSNHEEISKSVGKSMNRIYELSPTDKNFNNINTEMGKQVFELIHNSKESDVPNVWFKNLNKEFLK